MESVVAADPGYCEALSISVRRNRADAPTFVRGDGCFLVDAAGKRYLDMTGGSGAVNLGHQRPEIVEALRRQAGELIHTGWNFDGAHRHAMIERLSRLLPYPEAAVMGAVTGAEAIEVAQKIARAKTQREDILYFEDSFHGKTQGALSVTSNPRFRAHLARRLAEHPRMSLAGAADDAARWGQAFAERLCALRAEGRLPAAVIIEPIQAAEGIHEVPRPVLAQLVEVCRALGVVSIFDEIYTGLGRTGARFVADRGLCPDLMVIGKALGNGFPISAVAGAPSLVDVLGYSAHSSTFTFMPLACAVACAALDIHLAEEPWRHAAEIGAALAPRLRALGERDGRIRDVRGRGLMLAFDFVDDAPGGVARLAERLEARGVLVRTGGRSGAAVKLTPPLCFSAADAERFLAELVAAAGAA